MAGKSILLYSASGGGKTTQIGELAEHVHTESNGQKKLRLYTADSGGYESIKPHINLGLIEVIELYHVNPWILEWAVEGRVPTQKAGEAWATDQAKNDKIGAYAFEGLTSWASLMMGSLAKRAAKGENHGGEANVKISGNAPQVGETGADGITVGGSNKAHYAIVQNRIRDLVFRSMRLPGFVLWTALDQRGTDQEGMQTILGPQVVGKALAEIVPQWFSLSFHLVTIPKDGTALPEYKMFVVPHRDTTAPGAVALANARQPLDVPEGKKLPQAISPSSLKEALKKLQGAEEAATDALKARLAKLVAKG